MTDVRISNSVFLVYSSQTIFFYRGNLVGEDHPTKSVVSVSLSVTCSVPSAITLLIDEPGALQSHSSPQVVLIHPLSFTSNKGRCNSQIIRLNNF